jgi:phospholipid/cholesterol/gamma-HCH transport system substrate-binding protein
MAPRRSVPQRVSDSFRTIAQLDLSHRYETQVGLITLLVLAGLVVLGLGVSGWRLGGGGRVEVPVRFANVVGLSRGDVVEISGVRVGRVQGVTLEPTGDVLVLLRLDRALRPRSDATVRIVSLDLIGDRVVDYSPGVAPTFLPPGEVIAGVVPGGLQERLAAVAASARELTGGTAALSGAELRQDVAAAQAATGRALTVLGRVQGDSLLAATAQALRTSRAMFARLDSVAAMLAAEAPGSGLQRAAASAGDLAEAAGSARNALERMRLRLDRGEGGVARLSHDSAFRAELDATRRSLDLLLAKYGGRRAPDGPGSR